MSGETNKNPMNILSEIQTKMFYELTSELYWSVYHRYLDACDLIGIETWQAHALGKIRFNKSNSMWWFTKTYQVISKYFLEWFFPNGQLILQLDPTADIEDYLEKEWCCYFKSMFDNKCHDKYFVRDFVQILVADDDNEKFQLGSRMATDFYIEFMRLKEENKKTAA